jgi:hypothetical protein
VDGFGYFPKEESNPRGGSRTEQGNLAETRARTIVHALRQRQSEILRCAQDDKNRRQ